MKFQTTEVNLSLLSFPQIPGVPIMYITQHQYSIERLPEATIGGGKDSSTGLEEHVCYLQLQVVRRNYVVYPIPLASLYLFKPVKNKGFNMSLTCFLGMGWDSTAQVTET